MPNEEIRRWARRLWLRHAQRRFFRYAAALAAGGLLGYALLVHLLVQTGSGVLPTPSGLLKTALALALLAFFASLLLALSRRFSGFLRFLDRSFGWGERLSTWRDVERRGEKTPVADLFVEDLRRSLLRVDVGTVLRERAPRWPRFASLAAALLYLLLLLPWGGGLLSRAGGESDEGSKAVSADRAALLEPGSGRGAEGGTSPDRGGASAGSTGEQGGPSAEKPTLPPRAYEIEAKFVPAQTGAGPTTLKEVLTYDLPAPAKGRSAPEERTVPLSQKYPELRRAAEEAIRRDRLEPDEASFVMRYFDRIRP